VNSIRESYLQAAESAAILLAEPAVATAWNQPSALADFTVGGLASHLAGQILVVPATLGEPAPEGDPVGVLGHYGRVAWIGADLDDDVNVTIRRNGERLAEDGPAALAERAAAGIAELRPLLESAPADRVVHPPAGPWGLLLDDFLVTRMMEIAVHSDDLACSVGLETPPLPADVMNRVLELLVVLAARRHGATAVLRALSRAERAPTNVTAF
jgi:hypothetical protein